MHKQFDVIGIGVSTIDFIQVVDYFPDKEDVQKSSESSFDGGGPVATAIAALSKLGAKAAMIDSIGTDWKGNLILNEFKKEKVETGFIKSIENCTSSIASILVRKKDGARTIIYSPGNAPELNENDFNFEILKQTKFLHVNGRHFNFCLAACKYAKENGVKVSFDGGSHRYREEINSLIPLIDICIVTKEFAKSFSKLNSEKGAAEFILDKGPEVVVITNGIKGSWLFTKEINEHYQQAIISENVIDTTGCGDCYHGAFLYCLSKDYDLFKSIEFASAAASLNTRALGGRKGLPSEKEVLEIMKQKSFN